MVLKRYLEAPHTNISRVLAVQVPPGGHVPLQLVYLPLELLQLVQTLPVLLLGRVQLLLHVLERVLGTGGLGGWLNESRGRVG